MFHLPCPGKSDRATRDERRRQTRRVHLSISPQWLLTLARLPANPQVEAPESPGPRGQQMANENDWPTPAGHFPLRYLRHGLPSPDDAQREKRMEEEQ